jgi:hypothetical protein
MTDVKSQEKADRRKAQARGRQAIKASGNESGSLSVSAERDKPSD